MLCNKNYEKAIVDYTKAIDINDSYEDAYNNRGVIFYIKQEYEKAINDYTKVIKLNPNNRDVYYNLALICKGKNESEKHVEYIEELWLESFT